MNMNPFDPSNKIPMADMNVAQPATEQAVQPVQPVQQFQPVQPVQQFQPETITTIPQPQVNIATPQPELQTQQAVQQPVQNPTPVTPGPIAQPIPTVTPATPVQSVQPIQPQPQPNPMMPQPKVQQQPATSTGFTPIMQPGQSVVSRFSPAKFDAFVKVLNVLDDKNIIVIDRSRICQSINNGTAILMTDISGLIDDSNNKISLHVLNPKKYIKYFKNMKGSSDIYILDDPNGQRYIITNGDVMIYLPKQIEEFERDAAPPDLTSANLVGAPIDIDKDTRNTIISMSSDTSHIDLLLHQNQMKAVYIPELAVFSFKQFVSDQIDDSKAELRLRSYSFLNVPGEEYRVTLGEVHGNYWITTLVNTGFIAVHIIESLQPVSDENLIL